MSETEPITLEPITLEIPRVHIKQKLDEWAEIDTKASHIGKIIDWLLIGGEVSFVKMSDGENPDSYLAHVKNANGYECDLSVIHGQDLLAEIIAEFRDPEADKGMISSKLSESKDGEMILRLQPQEQV